MAKKQTISEMKARVQSIDLEIQQMRLEEARARHFIAMQDLRRLHPREMREYEEFTKLEGEST